MFKVVPTVTPRLPTPVLSTCPLEKSYHHYLLPSADSSWASWQELDREDVMGGCDEQMWAGLPILRAALGRGGEAEG